MGGMPQSTNVGTAVCSPLPNFVLEDFQRISERHHTAWGSAELLASGADAYVVGMYFAD